MGHHVRTEVWWSMMVAERILPKQYRGGVPQASVECQEPAQHMNVNTCLDAIDSKRSVMDGDGMWFSRVLLHTEDILQYFSKIPRYPNLQWENM